MASDLSQLIQDGLCSTLNGLLAKETKLKESTKTHIKDIEGIENLKVDVIFDFEMLSSTLSFLIPAQSASYIFNTMMGDTEAAIVDTIDDDTKDAIEEFVSNTSGSLVTAINGSSFADLGSVKFSIAHSEVINGSDISSLENIFRFLIDLEGHELVIFIAFDGVIIPHIDILQKLDLTVHEEIAEVIEEPEEVKEEIKEVEKEEKPKEVIKDNSTEDELPKEKLDDTNDNSDKKIKLIIFAVAGLLGAIIVAGIIMFFMGVFDEPEPIIVEDLNKTKEVKKDEVEVIQYTTLKKVNFKHTDINKNRLNAKLMTLTKQAVLTKEELSVVVKQEKERLNSDQREKKLLEFALANKEEPLTQDKELKKVTKEKTIIEEEVKIEKLQYIMTNSLQYKLFTNLIKESNSKEVTPSICSDTNGKTIIYIGPFKNEEELNAINNLISEQDSNIKTSKINITKEEFTSKCDFE